jgi:hypothetical protein
MVEEYNEYGKDVEDLVRRFDAEIQWQQKEEALERERIEFNGAALGYGLEEEDGEYEDWDGEVDLSDPTVGARKYVRGGVRGNVRIRAWLGITP